jgi:hypothetical protein
MFAPKTGADDVTDQWLSTRRVLFSTSEDLMQNRQAHVPGVGVGETVPGCSGMTMLMPRELGLGQRRCERRTFPYPTHFLIHTEKALVAQAERQFDLLVPDDGSTS